MLLLIARPQLHVVWLLLLLYSALVLSMLLLPMLAAASETRGGLPPGCSSTSICGDISIPYPFGINEGCSWNKSFTIYCNHSHNPPKPYYRNHEVIDITLETGEMRIVATAAHICYNSSNTTYSRRPQKLNFTGTPFQISPARNEFTGIGCHTMALLQGKDSAVDGGYLSGCITTCASLDDAAVDGDECTGLGCCQMPTPGGVDILTIGWSFGNFTPINRAWKYSSCSYGFVAEKGWYNFSRSDLNVTSEMAIHKRFPERKAPLVLTWAISDDNGACVSNHSVRNIVREGKGYLCNCSEGYAGNPYVIVGGCENINECELRKSDPKTYENLYPCPSGSKCIDTDGGYKCECNFGRRGLKCRPIFPATAAAVLATFVASVLLALLLCFVRKEHKRRMRRGFFTKNGGDILKHININIFTELQLERITNHYDTPIGRGAFGKVYMGTTDDNQRVAVKRSVAEGQSPSHDDHEMANEIAVQFRISHANLVRLVGCCLETDVPMLVFEYVSHGSLHKVLHGGTKRRALPLPARLDIAVGSANALAYMHSHGGHNLVHGDVKSGNILLGDNWTPKVSDFGTSKLVSIARYANWCVIGDMSYIDPAYIKTGRFTEKSDVYSFGVVLLELITRKTAKYDGNNSLAINFVKCCKEDGNGGKMYDRDILTDDSAQSHHYMECLDRIGTLAVRCLKEDVDERPSMAEVAEELKQVKLISSEGAMF
ncbi:hypothetical protein ACP70R_008134 [Stipagrostis hirtigluma subsp. patula]